MTTTTAHTPFIPAAHNALFVDELTARGALLDDFGIEPFCGGHSCAPLFGFGGLHAARGMRLPLSVEDNDVCGVASRFSEQNLGLVI